MHNSVDTRDSAAAYVMLREPWITTCAVLHYHYVALPYLELYYRNSIPYIFFATISEVCGTSSTLSSALFPSSTPTTGLSVMHNLLEIPCAAADDLGISYHEVLHQPNASYPLYSRSTTDSHPFPRHCGNCGVHPVKHGGGSHSPSCKRKM